MGWAQEIRAAIEAGARGRLTTGDEFAALQGDRMSVYPVVGVLPCCPCCPQFAFLVRGLHQFLKACAVGQGEVG